ncbi:MAG: peptidase M4 family protein [Candidatus Lindowbacteria bacterium]|nr:peptidase M4 family protein [Candidatus Lindowbacteria bacterium]
MKSNRSAKIITAIALITVMAVQSNAFALVACEGTAIAGNGGSADPSTILGLKSVVIHGLKQPVTGPEGYAAISAVDGLMKAAGSQATVQKIQIDELGYKHIRLAQQYKGLPVVGGELIVHINDKNIIYQINGKYLPKVEVAVEPAIDADAALQIGLDEQKDKAYMHVSQEPSLVIYGSKLAYHYVISHEGEVPGQWFYYVDAHTGELILSYNNIQFSGPTGDGTHEPVSGSRLVGEDGSVVTMTGWKETSGNYYLYNYIELWGVYNEDTFDWEQRPISDWGTKDRAAISLGYNFSLTQDIVMNVIGRNSYDDAGGFARGNAHTGTNYVNAYWDGTDFHFGDGDGVTADPLATLDIAAHEYGHAITQYTSNLVYAYEPGALNESYSDLFGAVVEFSTQPDGTASYPSSTPGYSDWLMGEDAWLSGEALRDLLNPQRYYQPSYYHGTYWYYGSGDSGGVHTNSGVQNFAFYLLSVGGTGTNDGHPYNITGVGLEAASWIAWRANEFYLTSNAQYSDSREAWISAATDLGYSAETVGAVWTAVGVLPPPDPAVISSFVATGVSGGVELTWTTDVEFECFGWNIMRGKNESGPFKQINKKPIPGGGTTSEPRDYSFVDRRTIAGTQYFYYLQEVYTSGDAYDFEDNVVSAVAGLSRGK